jgi:fucose 4-O-acetylase-like acetyltransferase
MRGDPSGILGYDSALNNKVGYEVMHSRDLRLDAVKGFLVILVIFGHLLTQFIWKSPLYQAVYAAIFVFHMPLFILISGMFSKSSPSDADYRSILTRLAIPLVLFQILYIAIDAAWHGQVSTPALEPYWILWFLLSLIMWKIALPLFSRIRYGFALAVGIALVAGFNSEIGWALSLSRSLYFFPFFIFGHTFRTNILGGLQRWRVASALILPLVLGAVAYWSLNGLNHTVLYGASGYSVAAVLAPAPALGRGLLIAASLAASLAFLSLFSIPSQLVAYLGQRSLSIFLLHGFAVLVVKKLYLSPTVSNLTALLIGAIAIAFATAWTDPYLSRLYAAIARVGYKPG